MTEKSPESDPKSRAWARLFVTTSLLMDKVESALKRAGLPSLAWYDVLWVLEEGGGRLRMHELATRVVLSRYNLTRLADRLEDEGLIRRERSDEDRRGAYCVLADKGRSLRRRMWPVYKAQVDSAFSDRITLEEARTMVSTLEKVRAHLLEDSKEE